MHAYRSHSCGELTAAHVGQSVRLSGWINRKRDHGQLVFVDLRDHYGLTQCVVDSSEANFAAVEATRLESVVTITGTVLKRSDETINSSLPTGEIEVKIESFEVQSAADTLPLQVNSDADSGEETRLRYRYLDLRRSRPHENIMLRAKIIQSILTTGERDELLGQLLGDSLVELGRQNPAARATVFPPLQSLPLALWLKSLHFSTFSVACCF